MRGKQHSLDIIGKRFGLMVVESTHVRSGHSRGVVICDCGTRKETRISSLLSGIVKACGCQQGKPRHGMARTLLYRTWTSLVSRCEDNKHPQYARYGGRGIYVSREWREKFENFYRDMGPKPPGLSIDRIDNDGPYSKENCRWATNSQQGRNTSRTIMVTVGGKKIALADAAEEVDLKYSIVYGRIRKGWSLDDALKKRTPPMVRYKGRSITVLESSKITGINHHTIRSRIKARWPEDKIFSPPRRAAK